MVPCPAMTSGWSNGGINTPPVSATTSCARPLSRSPVAAQHDFAHRGRGWPHLDVRASPRASRCARARRRRPPRRRRPGRGCRWSTRRRPWRRDVRPASRPSALNAPRTLNAPMGCRFSGLTHNGRSSSPHRRGQQRSAHDGGLIRSAAARMSSIVTTLHGSSLVHCRGRAQTPAGSCRRGSTRRT